MYLCSLSYFTRLEGRGLYGAVCSLGGVGREEGWEVVQGGRRRETGEKGTDGWNKIEKRGGKRREWKIGGKGKREEEKKPFPYPPLLGFNVYIFYYLDTRSVRACVRIHAHIYDQ